MTLQPRTIVIVALLIIAAQALALYWLGNALICPCGKVKWWDGVVQGVENSQHLFDWYSLSHTIYGFVLYFVLWLVNKKLRWPIGVLLLIALAVSAGWEIFENTQFVVNHYRGQVLSVEYNGDSIVNSVVDTLALEAGFLLAWYLPVWLVVALIVALELFVAVHIHDSFLVSLITFFHPVEFISSWQASLSP